MLVPKSVAQSVFIQLWNTHSQYKMQSYSSYIIFSAQVNLYPYDPMKYTLDKM